MRFQTMFCAAGAKQQAGWATVIHPRFAYIMDVFVDSTHRRNGIAENMVKFAMAHPAVMEVYLWLLATRDGHSVYGKAGFGPLPVPEMWMIQRKEKIRPA